jgi:hypothetical protein
MKKDVTRLFLMTDEGRNDMAKKKEAARASLFIMGMMR